MEPWKCLVKGHLEGRFQFCLDRGDPAMSAISFRHCPCKAGTKMGCLKVLQNGRNHISKGCNGP